MPGAQKKRGEPEGPPRNSLRCCLGLCDVDVVYRDHELVEQTFINVVLIDPQASVTRTVARGTVIRTSASASRHDSATART